MLRYSIRLSLRTRHAARVEILGVDTECRVLDPVLEDLPLLAGGPRLAGRRHDAGPHVLEHRPTKDRDRATALDWTQSRRGSPRPSCSRCRGRCNNCLRESAGSSRRNCSLVRSAAAETPEPGIRAASTTTADQTPTGWTIPASRSGVCTGELTEQSGMDRIPSLELEA